MIGIGIGLYATGPVSRADPDDVIRDLFGNGEPGAWYDPSDLSTLFQDAAGTVPVTGSGQPVGCILDKSGNGNHAVQADPDLCPYLQVAGNLRYLSFNDDCLSTGDIDFTATDRITVWTGVRKLSDAGAGVVVELSANAALLPGTFAILAPGEPDATSYAVRSSGTAHAACNSANLYPAPITNVVTLVADIAAPALAIRANQSPQATLESQGTGNYGQYPIWLGRRNGTSMGMVGRMYGLIVRGAQSTPEQVRATEQYLARKSGITLA